MAVMDNDMLSADMQQMAERLSEVDNSQVSVVARILAVKVEAMPDMTGRISDVIANGGKWQHQVLFDLAKAIVATMDGNLWAPEYITDARVQKNVHVYTGMYWAVISNQTFYDFVGDCATRAGLPENLLTDPQFMTKLYERVFFNVARDKQPVTNKTLINLMNGTLEICKDGRVTLREHNREDYLTYVLDYVFDPQAECPRFHDYLDHVLPDAEVQQFVSEFIGYCFTKGIKAEKMLVLLGAGSNGKSVLLEVIERLFGVYNVSNISLSDLTNDPERRTGIEGKMVNISHESDRGVQPDVLKTLVSGEPIMVRKLYVGSYRITDYAKLITSFNQLPKAENTGGFYRRFAIVEFNVTIADEEADIDLPNKLATELPGILNWVIAGLRSFLAKGRLVLPEASMKSLSHYKLLSDNVRLFLNECCQMDSSLTTAGSELYKAYRSYCVNDQLKPLGKQRFYDRLEALGARRDTYQNNIRFNVYIDTNEPF